MKSRFLIFTLFLAVMCIGSAGNAMAQSVTGTGVFSPPGNGAPNMLTISAQQGGNGGVVRFTIGQSEIVARPVDICVQANAIVNGFQGNAAFVEAEITHASGDFAGTEGQFLELGVLDTEDPFDLFLVSELSPSLISPTHIPACDSLATAFSPSSTNRGGWQVKL